MGKNIVAFTEKQLKEIGDYVETNLPAWLHRSGFGAGFDSEQRHRIVRIEEELKNQRKLMEQGFTMMDKHSEQVESRMDNFSRRMFQFMVWSFGFTASAAAIVIAALR